MYKRIVESINNYKKVSRPANSMMAKNSYNDAVDALNKLQSNAEYIKTAKVQNNQENNMQEMAKFLNRTGISLDQLDTLKIIHITGTNGKGTTCSYCESILRNHNFKTGFYSSPHLLEIRERIRLNGKPISKEKFAHYFWNVYNRLEKAKDNFYDMPLYFRFLTILAFHVFLKEKVDVAIMEVGIGGEYDCTNIVRKTRVAAITPIDLDHTSLLGDNLRSIAWNKAGIMKPGAEVFTSSIQPDSVMEVLMERSKERCCKLNLIENFYNEHYQGNNYSTIPVHIQKTNASLALAISKCFIEQSKLLDNGNNNGKEFNLELAKDSIESALWPGRYEIIQRKNCVYFLDGAHTCDSMQVCSSWYFSKTSKNISHQQKVLIFNVTGERDPECLLRLLKTCNNFKFALFIPNVGYEENDLNNSSDIKDLIQPVNFQLERCYRNKEIWDKLCENSVSKVFSSFSKAKYFLESQSENEFNVLITGSIHLIGASLSILNPTLDGLL